MHSLCLVQIMTAVGQEGQLLDMPTPTEAELAAGEGPIVTGLTSLISKCWAAEPSARPSMPVIISHLRQLLETRRTLQQQPSGSMLQRGPSGVCAVQVQPEALQPAAAQDVRVLCCGRQVGAVKWMHWGSRACTIRGTACS